MADSVELTILMPCLNEAETLARCIEKAKLGIERSGVRGEIIIADNGSVDDSIEIAEKSGARVVQVIEKGYGSALRGGIQAAAGKWILMGDADDSYDFSEITGFVEQFQEGFDLIMGCRLPIGGGIISPGAMPWKNRRIGNPILSFVGRVFFKCPAHDFHCGLRGFTKAAFWKMDLQTTGMEFASEMVIKSTFKKLKIAEVPITLHKDGRSRPPHLKPWRDGWRHLRFMLLFSPRWLFLAPGIFLSGAGILFAAALSLENIKIGGVAFDVGTLVVACMTVIIGFQLVAFAFFTKVFAIAEGLLPDDAKFSRAFKFFNLEKGILLGLAVLLTGMILSARALWIWKQAGFGELSPEENLRRLIPAATLIVLGIQSVFSSFFMSALGLKTASRKPPALPKA
ncbi:MAG TPA: glycosyltransferase family 2 protein [Verrucomicrobiae bacterium]|nr:glycosyltransferase family 2 protein [Verrucomicrobiae bacterium]